MKSDKTLIIPGVTEKRGIELTHDFLPYNEFQNKNLVPNKKTREMPVEAILSNLTDSIYKENTNTLNTIWLKEMPEIEKALLDALTKVLRRDKANRSRATYVLPVRVLYSRYDENMKLSDVVFLGIVGMKNPDSGRVKNYTIPFVFDLKRKDVFTSTPIAYLFSRELTDADAKELLRVNLQVLGKRPTPLPERFVSVPLDGVYVFVRRGRQYTVRFVRIIPAVKDYNVLTYMLADEYHKTYSPEGTKSLTNKGIKLLIGGDRVDNVSVMMTTPILYRKEDKLTSNGSSYVIYAIRYGYRTSPVVIPFRLLGPDEVIYLTNVLRAGVQFVGASEFVSITPEQVEPLIERVSKIVEENKLFRNGYAKYPFRTPDWVNDKMLRLVVYGYDKKYVYSGDVGMTFNRGVLFSFPYIFLVNRANLEPMREKRHYVLVLPDGRLVYKG